MPTFTFWNFINYSTQKCRPYLPRTVVLGLGVFAVVVVYSWMQRFPQRLWWIELKQNVHYDVVEGDIWHTTPDMLDHKYKKNYRMSFLAFEHLVLEQILFLRLIDYVLWDCLAMVRLGRYLGNKREQRFWIMSSKNPNV